MKVDFHPLARDLQYYLVHWVQIFPMLKTPLKSINPLTQLLNLSTSN